MKLTEAQIRGLPTFSCPVCGSLGGWERDIGDSFEPICVMGHRNQRVVDAWKAKGDAVSLRMLRLVQAICFELPQAKAATVKPAVVGSLTGTHCDNGHELNEVNLFVGRRRDGRIVRRCRVCDRGRRVLGKVCASGHPRTEANTTTVIRKNGTSYRVCTLCLSEGARNSNRVRHQVAV